MSDADAELKTSRKSAPARMVAHGWENLAQPGDFYYDGPRMVIWLPGLTKWAGTIAINVRAEGAAGPVWQMSGTPERPTLAPSIRTSVCHDPSNPEMETELWHGWLRDGTFVSC